MGNRNISEVFYSQDLTPEYDREHYRSDPEGNLSSSLQQAIDAYLRQSEPDIDSFKEYMKFSFGRSFVNADDVKKWFDGLPKKPNWRDMQANGSGRLVRNLINEVFPPK